MWLNVQVTCIKILFQANVSCVKMNAKLVFQANKIVLLAMNLKNSVKEAAFVFPNIRIVMENVMLVMILAKLALVLHLHSA